MTEQAEDEQADAGPTGDEQADSGQASARRASLVAIAQEQWAAALTDLGGRNTLLYYKDRRAGTLDLAAADPEAPPGRLRLLPQQHALVRRPDHHGPSTPVRR